jgi:hypothetical protein
MYNISLWFISSLQCRRLTFYKDLQKKYKELWENFFDEIWKHLFLNLVLIVWNPRMLFRNLYPYVSEVENILNTFLISSVCITSPTNFFLIGTATQETLSEIYI